jgi:hypothetical protein
MAIKPTRKYAEPRIGSMVASLIDRGRYGSRAIACLTLALTVFALSFPLGAQQAGPSVSTL